VRHFAPLFEQDAADGSESRSTVTVESARALVVFGVDNLTRAANLLDELTTEDA